MSTLKADAVTAKSTNTDCVVTGAGTGVPDIETGFKISGTAGLPINNLRAGTDGELITWDASGDPAAVAVGTATHVLTSNGIGAAPTFQAAGGGGGFTLGTPITTTSGTSFSFTGIPTGTKVLILMWEQVSVADGTDIYMQLGDAGGIETTGYVGKTGEQGATNIYIDNSAGTSSTITTAFPIGVKDGGGFMNGQVTLRLLNSSTNLWSYTAMISGDGGCIVIGAGSKPLSGELTQFTVAGNTFDLGQANIMYSS